MTLFVDRVTFMGHETADFLGLVVFKHEHGHRAAVIVADVQEITTF